MTKIELQLVEIREKEKNLIGLLEKQRANKQFRCGCGKMHRIKDCVVIQDHYYVPPSGCTDGAYWTPTELQIICPDTDNKNRLLFNIDCTSQHHFEYNASDQFKLMYKHLFKEVIDDYKKDKRQWWNNFYIDKHPEKFGLCVKGRKYK